MENCWNENQLPRGPINGSNLVGAIPHRPLGLLTSYINNQNEYVRPMELNFTDLDRNIQIQPNIFPVISTMENRWNENSMPRGPTNEWNLERTLPQRPLGPLTIHINNENENVAVPQVPRGPARIRGHNRLYRRFRPSDVDVLEAQFKKDDHPLAERITHLSIVLGREKKNIVSWFARRRKTERKRKSTLLSDPPQQQNSVASTPTWLRVGQTIDKRNVANFEPPTTTQACSCSECTRSNTQEQLLGDEEKINFSRF